MSIPENTISTNQLCTLLEITNKTALDWLKKGGIKAERINGGRREWYITAEDLAEFLHHNPKYEYRFRRVKLRGIFLNRFRFDVVKLLDAMPKLYATTEICNMFAVTNDAVIYWMKKGLITPIPTRPIYGEHLFTQKELCRFVHICPRYFNFYKLYMGRTRKHGPADLSSSLENN